VALLDAGSAQREVPLLTRVYVDSLECRGWHGCTVWPFEQGQWLAGLAARLKCERILDVGCGLGYATLVLAGAAKGARVDAIELDPVHARGARENFALAGLGRRIVLHECDFAELLARLTGRYDLVLFDCWPMQVAHLRELERLVRRGGLLVSVTLAASPAYADLRSGGLWRTDMLDDLTTASERL
jgi:predicted O-methyltransferase YrrM